MNDPFYNGVLLDNLSHASLSRIISVARKCRISIWNLLFPGGINGTFLDISALELEESHVISLDFHIFAGHLPNTR